MMCLSKPEARHSNCRHPAVISDCESKVKHNSAVWHSGKEGDFQGDRRLRRALLKAERRQRGEDTVAERTHRLSVCLQETRERIRPARACWFCGGYLFSVVQIDGGVCAKENDKCKPSFSQREVKLLTNTARVCTHGKDEEVRNKRE